MTGAVKDYGDGTTVVAPQPGVYKGKMGTGAVDAWRFMMNIEGTPCAQAICCKSQGIDLSEWFGGAAAQLTYQDLEYSDEDAESLGLKDAPYINRGRLFLHPTKCGSIKIKINAVGGGSHVGGDTAAGGMAFSRTVSVIVRPHRSGNGGWL